MISPPAPSLSQAATNRPPMEPASGVRRVKVKPHENTQRLEGVRNSIHRRVTVR